MHLLLIHQAFVTPGKPGGTRHFELCRRLVENRHRVTIVASAVDYMSGKNQTRGAALVQRERLAGIEILRAATPAVLHASFIWRVISFLVFMLTAVFAGLRAKRPDLVMGTSPLFFQAVSAWAVARLRRAPFLLEIRDLWPEFAIDMGVLRSPVLIRLSRFLEHFLYRRADHFLVNSPAYRDYLKKKGIPAVKISFVPNGVDPAMFPAEVDGSAIRRRYGLKGKFVATYAGALGMANDLGSLLAAAARLRSETAIHFLVVGDGKERTRLEAEVRSKGLENVTFTGPRPKSEMPQFLAASDVCLAILMDIPMFRTTYPNKVFDYMAAGRPTILAIDGVIREVIEAARGGIFVPPGDPEALAAAVERLAADPEAVRTMGAAARGFVVAHFDRNRQAAEFADLVGRLAQRRDGPQIGASGDQRRLSADCAD